MRSAMVVVMVILGIAGAAFRAEGMLVDNAIENNIPGDCRAVAQVLVQLAIQKATSSPQQLHQAAGQLLTAKGYKGSFGNTDFIAPFYASMILQSSPEVDQFMTTATAKQLAQMEEEEEVSCMKEALIEISSRSPGEDAATPPTPTANHSH